MTKTFDFDLPTDRFDTSIAESGIWEPVIDENGTKYGEFLIGLQDDSNPRHKLAKKRFNKTHATKLNGMTNFEQLVELFVELPVLMNWRGVKAGGKDLPFSKEAAKAYLGHEKFYYVFEQLWPMTHDVTRFQKPNEETPDEIAGN